MLVCTKPEDESDNRTLALHVDPDTLLGTIHANDNEHHTFHISHCIDENEERVPHNQISHVLKAGIPSSYVSIITSQDLEVRVVLDFALDPPPHYHSGCWGLFEIFGKLEDTPMNRTVSIDTDRWTPPNIIPFFWL